MATLTLQILAKMSNYEASCDHARHSDVLEQATVLLLAPWILLFGIFRCCCLRADLVVYIKY